MPLDHQTYLKTKVVGDHSMSGKAGCSETAKLHAGRGPNGTVKAKLLEPQCPYSNVYWSETAGDIRYSQETDVIHSRQEKWNRRGPISIPRHSWGVGSPIATSRTRTRHLNHSERHLHWNAGFPNRREPHGNGVSVVVRVRESLAHGEGRQVSQMTRMRRNA